MKLTKTLQILLTGQVIMYCSGMYVLYSSSRDGVDDFAGLGALLPFGIFLSLGVVNLIILIIYGYKIYSKNLKPDIIVSLLTMIVILLVLLYKPLVDWALSGPG